MDSLEQGWELSEAWNRLVIPAGTLFACWGLGTPEISLTVILILVIIAAFVERPARKKPNWLDFAIAGFLTTSIISSLRGDYLPNSLSALRQLVEACLVYKLVRSDRKKDSGFLYLALVFAGTITACYSFFLFVREYQTWKSFGFSDPTLFRQKLTLTGFPSYSADEHLWFILFASIGLLSIVLKTRTSIAYRILEIACFAINVLCLLLSFSRLAYASFAVGASVFCLLAILYRQKVKKFTVIVSFTGVMLILCFLSFLDLFKPIATTIQWNNTVSQSRSTAGRVQIALGALRMTRAHRWFGVGPGNFGHSNLGVVRANGANYSPQPFNWFLQITVEQGLVGLLAGVGLFVACGIICIQFVRNHGICSTWGIVASSSVAAIIVFNCGQAAFFANRHLGDLSATWLALIGNGAISCEKP